MTKHRSISQARSIIFLPFDLNVSNNDIKDPYVRITKKSGLRNSLNDIFKPFKKVDEFINAICNDGFIAAKSIIDPSKYHDFIVNNFAYNKGTENTNDIGFIQWFEKEKYSSEKYTIENNEVSIEKYSVIFNKLTLSGAIIIEINWEGEADKLDLLSKLNFFRYHDSIRSKKDLMNKDGINKTLNDIVLMHYSQIAQKIFFNHVKPIVIHILVKDFNSIKKSNEEFSELIYKTIRVPKKNMNEDFPNLKMNYSEVVNLKYRDKNIVHATMNEGVLVIDNGEDSIQSALNKYLPAFILALNQREFLLKIIRLVPSVNVKKINELRELKKYIAKIYLEQISFTVSFYNEIDLFFKDLQHKFDIETLMKDNKESIDEIHRLIESEEKENQEKKQKNLNTILLVLTIIQAFSFFYTLVHDKFGDSENLFEGFMLINILFLTGGIIFILFPNLIKSLTSKE
jgi:hypothetical protein